MCVYFDSTYEEQERRVRQIEQLRSKAVQMHRLFENNGSEVGAVARSKLMGGAGIPVQDLGTAEWGTDDDELLGGGGAGDYSSTTESLRAQQQRMAQGKRQTIPSTCNIQIYVYNFQIKNAALSNCPRSYHDRRT